METSTFLVPPFDDMVIDPAYSPSGSPAVSAVKGKSPFLRSDKDCFLDGIPHALSSEGLGVSID